MWGEEGKKKKKKKLMREELVRSVFGLPISDLSGVGLR